MNKFEAMLLKWDFKKIAKRYLILAVVAAVCCTAAVGIVYRDRLSFAWQFERVREAVEKKAAPALQGELDKLASASSDVVDILILDSGNHVTYSTNRSEFSTGPFNLSRSGENRTYLVSDANAGVVFRAVKSDEFMLNSVFNHDFGEIQDEYDNESFFEHDAGSKTVYLLSFLGDKNSGSKIYIISNPTSVAGGMLTLKVVACVAMLLFMAYWVLLALWAYQNASRAKLYPLFWGVIVLLTNLAGVMVYQLYKRGNAACPACGASQSRSHIYCTSCGTQLGETCQSCGAHLSARDLFCPGCGKKIR